LSGFFGKEAGLPALWDGELEMAAADRDT